MKKSYTISIPVGVFWKVVVPIAVATLGLGAIVGVFIVDRIVVPNLPGISNRGVVKVPRVAGLDYEDARQRLYDVGLRLQVTDRQYSDSVPEGTVLSQRPESGEEVKKGRHIGGVISRGPEVDTIPDIHKTTEGVGKKKLRDEGFGNLRTYRVYDSRVPKDHVVYTRPAAGTIISREIMVEVMLSRGPKPTHANVPNLIGDMLSDARTKISESGLKSGRVTYEQSSTSRPGAVISQSLPPGASVPLESAVDMVVAGSR
jgi:serine/threonine-protein kinase